MTWSARFGILAKVCTSVHRLVYLLTVGLGPSFADVKAQIQHEERRSANDEEYMEVVSKGRATFIALGIWNETAWYVRIDML
jgi:hypothetical protein